MNVPNDVKVIEHFLKIHEMAFATRSHIHSKYVSNKHYSNNSFELVVYFDSRYLTGTAI